MPAPVPAKKVAGTKNAPVRRKREAREVNKSSSGGKYSDALRAKCRKGAFLRKPADLKTCPECHSPGTVVTSLGFDRRFAGKWFHKCTHTITKPDGQKVGCKYFKVVTDQPPVPPAQVAVIERQRTADETTREAAQKAREADAAKRDSEKDPDNVEKQLHAVETAAAAALAAKVAENARKLALKDDESLWDRTPSPQPSSSRITLDRLPVVNPSSGSSTRTTTSQAQLEHDRHVALKLQAQWDAETSPSDGSRTAERTAASQNNPKSTTQTATAPSEASNRIRQAARLQDQAAQRLERHEPCDVSQTQPKTSFADLAAKSSSSPPVATPTPASKVRKVRPFPLDLAHRRNPVPTTPVKRAGQDTKSAVRDPGRVLVKATPEQADRAPADDPMAWDSDNPPPSTQPRRSATKRPRQPTPDDVISISSDDDAPPKRKPRVAHQAQVKKEATEPVLDDISGEAEVTPVPKKRIQPRPVRRSARPPKSTPRVAEALGHDSVPATVQAPMPVISATPSAPPAPALAKPLPAPTAPSSAVATLSPTVPTPPATARTLQKTARARATAQAAPQAVAKAAGGRSNNVVAIQDPSRAPTRARLPSSPLPPSDFSEEHSSDMSIPYATSDPEPAPRESSLQSSNKENREPPYFVTADDPIQPPSLTRRACDVSNDDEDDQLPPLEDIRDHSDDEDARLSHSSRDRRNGVQPHHDCPPRRTNVSQPPRMHAIHHVVSEAELPPVQLPYDVTCRARCCTFVGYQSANTDEEDTRFEENAPAARQTSDAEEDAVVEDEGEEGGKLGMDENMSQYSDLFKEDAEDDHVAGSERNIPGKGADEGDSASDSDADDGDYDEQDFADDTTSMYVEKSVEAAVKQPWTHDFDNVKAWYCTVFIWTEVIGRPRHVLLSMNSGETMLRLGRRRPVQVALDDHHVNRILVWNFVSTTWVEHDIDDSLYVSEGEHHTVLVRLPDVERCLDFGKAVAHAEERLWPANEETVEGLGKGSGVEKEDLVVLKSSRKGKEVVRR